MSKDETLSKKEIVTKADEYFKGKRQFVALVDRSVE
jgi:hypothetical protein